MYISTVGKSDSLLIYRVIYWQIIMLIASQPFGQYKYEEKSGVSFKRLNVISSIYGISPYRGVNTFCLGYKTKLFKH
jgi:hypothetical protein